IRTNKDDVLNEKYMQILDGLKGLDTKIPIVPILGFENEVSHDYILEMKKYFRLVVVLPEEAHTGASLSGLMAAGAIYTKICIDAGIKFNILDKSKITEEMIEQKAMEHYL